MAALGRWEHIEIGSLWTILVAFGIASLSFPVSFRLSRTWPRRAIYCLLARLKRRISYRRFGGGSRCSKAWHALHNNSISSVFSCPKRPYVLWCPWGPLP